MRLIGWLLFLAGTVLVFNECAAQEPARDRRINDRGKVIVSSRKMILSKRKLPIRRPRFIGFPGPYGLGPLDRFVGPPPGRVRISPFLDAPQRPNVLVFSSPIIVIQTPLYVLPTAPARLDPDVLPPPKSAKPRVDGREVPGTPKRPLDKVPPTPPLPPRKEVPKEKKAAPKPPSGKPAPKRPRPPAPADDPRDESDRLEDLGRESFQDLEYGRAAQRFRQAMRLAPSRAMPHFLLAQALLAQEKYHEAHDSILAGLKLKPDWPTEKFRPLELYGAAVGDYSDHLSALEEARRRHPDDPVLLFLLAYQLWFDGRKEEARPLFRRALPKASDRDAIDRFLRALPAEEL